MARPMRWKGSGSELARNGGGGYEVEGKEKRVGCKMVVVERGLMVGKDSRAEVQATSSALVREGAFW
jgi:hypothetical protein